MVGGCDSHPFAAQVSYQQIFTPKGPTMQNVGNMNSPSPDIVLIQAQGRTNDAVHQDIQSPVGGQRGS